MNPLSWFRGRRRRLPFSLELGPEFANVLALQGRSGLQQIEVLRSVALPALDLLNGSEADRLTLAQEVGDLVRLLELQDRPVRMILPADAVILRLLEVPEELTPLELQTRVLEQESELYLPFGRADADLDFFPLGPAEAGNRQVLLAAARRGYTDHCLQLADAIGCELASLEPSCLALIRAFRPLLSNGALTEGAALLCLGIQTSELTLLREGVPLFERVLNHGVRSILATVQPQAAQLPWGTILQTGLMSNVEVMELESPLQELVREIRRSLDFVAGQVEGFRASALFVCGPGSVLPELAIFLGARLGLRCERPDPWLLNGIEPPLDPVRKPLAPSQLSMLVGMALKEN